MKKIIMFVIRGCPYCMQARKLMMELKKEHPAYQNVEVDMIDENVHPEIAQKYDYYYVPTFFVEDKKYHEGVPSAEKIQAVFEAAIAE